MPKLEIKFKILSNIFQFVNEFNYRRTESMPQNAETMHNVSSAYLSISAWNYVEFGQMVYF